MFRKIRTIYGIISFLIILVIAGVPLLLIHATVNLFHHKTGRVLAWWLLRQLIHCFFFVNNIKIETIGEENLPKDGKFVLMSNHQDVFDIMAIYGFLKQPLAFVSKKEVVWTPVIGPWMMIMDCYLLDRKNPRQALKLFEKAAKNVKDGWPVIIFPEGTRSLGPKNGSFLAGSMRLALMSEAPIVPITLSGCWKPMHGNPNGYMSAKLSIVVGKPIDTSSYNKNNSKELAAVVQHAVEQGFTERNNEDDKAKAYAAKYH